MDLNPQKYLKFNLIDLTYKITGVAASSGVFHQDGGRAGEM